MTTAFGVCNVLARMITIMSPMLAEVKGTFPMFFF